MELWSGRGAFFAAMRLGAVPALEDLRDSCLAVFDEAKQVWRERLGHPPIKVTWPTMSIRTTPFGESGVAGRKLLTVRDVETLEQGAQHCELIAKLRDGFGQWCTKYRFTERWFAQSALTNLAMWSQDATQRSELCWPYPSSFVASEGTAEFGGRQYSVLSQSATGIGLKPIRFRFLPPSNPPQYNPYVETWPEYQEKIEVYRRESENALEQSGFRRRRPKRARTADASTHFVWLVQYQVLGWTRDQIAEQHDNTTELDPASVGEAVRKLAKSIRLELRQARGRPRSHR